ncbi:MAG TPA: DegV family protein [Acidimicrobiales bacterium]|jgi:DegV family protein with EDD domain|nr:DegV family protein [Acidimicrobiales bacterium]
MPGVHLVTDSSCDLPDDLVEEFGITIVPLTIRFGQEEFVDREELSASDFYKKMASTPELPETAAPAPGKFEAAFRAAKEAGADGVICINLSSKFSATMASAQNAARAVEGDLDVRVVDSRSVTMGLGNQLVAVGEAARDGASLDDLEQLAVSLSERTRVFGGLDTLENLKKGGRIGSAKALLGTMLAFKPVVDVSTGEVVEAAKPRTRTKQLQWLRDKLFEQEHIERVSVVHGDAPDLDAFLELLAPRYPRDQVSIGSIGPVIGTHGGPRVIGVCWQIPA